MIRASLFFLMLVTGTAVFAATEDVAPVADAVTAPKESSIPIAKEAEIPLHLEAKKEAAGEPNPFFRLIFGLSVLAAVAGGAWWYLRRYKKPGASQHAPQIKVLTQHYLGPKRSLLIVRVAGESILIGVTDQNISLIKSLSLIDDEIVDEVPAAFSGALARSEAKPTSSTTPAATAPLQDGEEFQLSGLHQIKDVVQRKLKNMRSLE